MIQLGSEGNFDGWPIRIEEVVHSDAARSLITKWNTSNAVPSEGMSFVAVRLTVSNQTNRSRILSSSSFLISGSDGVLRGSPDLAIPQMIDGVLGAGEQRQGWAVFTIDSPESPILWYVDGLRLPDRMEYSLSLSADSRDWNTILVDKSGVADVRKTPESAAGIGETVIAGDWLVSRDETETLEGQAVLDNGGSGLRALSLSNPEHIEDWLAVKLTITNADDRPAFFSPSATEIANSSGDPWDHILALTPPSPDVSVFLMPGSKFSGWTAFLRTDYGTKGRIYSNAELLRVLLSPLVDSPRWISFGTNSDTTMASDTYSWSAGAIAQVNDDKVNLRATASRTASVVTDLSRGEKVRVDGETVTADGIAWVPITVIASGQKGFVSASYLSSDGI